MENNIGFTAPQANLVTRAVRRVRSSLTNPVYLWVIVAVLFAVTLCQGYWMQQLSSVSIANAEAVKADIFVPHNLAVACIAHQVPSIRIEETALPQRHPSSSVVAEVPMPSSLTLTMPAQPVPTLLETLCYKGNESSGWDRDGDIVEWDDDSSQVKIAQPTSLCGA